MSKRSSALAAVLLLLLAASPAASAPAPASLPPQGPAQSAPGLSADDRQVLLDTLGRAESEGFDPDEFHLAAIRAQLGAKEVGERAEADRRLVAAAIAYARAERGQRLAPTSFPHNWAIRPARYDAEAAFTAALASHGLAVWAASLPPADPRYGRLVQLLAHYRTIAAQGGWPALAAKPALKSGATGPGVTALRRRLAIEDPALAAAAPPAKEDVYDAGLTAAVTRAQERYGLDADGVAGAATVAALNVPVETRLGQIRANLERWRWAPRNLPAYRVELNIADPSLELYDAGKPALGMRVIVGRPSKPTPMFQDRIRAVIFNPPWNVPSDIAAREIWPRIRRDAGYMAREGFVVRKGGGLQQRPGPKCALGTIKFDLSNSFGVYLHDTPARALFARDVRTLSHGCMRLEKPGELASRVLRGDPDWPQAKIDLTLQSGETVRATLRQPVPIYVFYWSVFVDADGAVAFRPDAYRWDARLLDLL